MFLGEDALNRQHSHGHLVSFPQGQTFIITNAMSGWVEYSAAKWVRSSDIQRLTFGEISAPKGCLFSCSPMFFFFVFFFMWPYDF